MGKPQLEWEMVYIFAAGQLLYVLNGSLAAMLQAVGKVDELAVSNFAAKILWAVGIVGGVALGGGVRMVAVAFLASEALRSWSLLRSARRHVGLRIHLELAGLKPILLICLPYMLHTIAHRIYATIDVTMLSWLTTDEEVGWYGAAISLMMLALMIIPVFQAVILPMGARIGQTSTVALNETMRAAVRLTLMFSAPLSLLLALDADAIVQTVYRESYAPSVGSLRVLGLLIPITCALTVGASQLLQHGRVWTLTKISIVAMVFNPTVNYLFIPWGLHHWGKGGGGLAAAIATVGTEVLVALLTFGALGREAWDRATARLLATLAGLAAVVVGLHFALPPFGIGKLFVEAAVYVALAMPLGALPLVDLANRILQRLAARRAARRG
jgi:O-antigen/teichoic acid export membrane protein